MSPSPRVFAPLLLALAVPPTPAGARTNVSELLAAVGDAARFPAPALAAGALTHRGGDGSETRETLRLAGRRNVVRIDAGSQRALVRLGKARWTDGAAPPRLGADVRLGTTALRLGDLAVFTPRLLRTPQIVDEGPAGTVVAGAPAPASPYALLVVTIDPARRVVTQVKYYEHTIANLVKRATAAAFVEVAGALRPTRITVWDLQGGGTTELELTWRAAPALPRALFTAAGLATPLPAGPVSPPTP